MRPRSTGEYIEALLAVEQAWTGLNEAARLANGDLQAALTLLRAAVAEGGQASQVLVRAGELLRTWGREEEARAVLADGVALDGPTAPLQLAYARSLRRLDEVDEARHWFQGAMLRARPDAAVILELAAMELEAGRIEDAGLLVAVARRLPCNHPAAAVGIGRELKAAGCGDLALAVFGMVYDRGYRDGAYLAEFARLLAEHKVDEPSTLAIPPLAMRVAAHAAHARLATSCDVPALTAGAQVRQASVRWVDLAGLPTLLAARIAQREPFSWIRLGDGEARFLLHVHPRLRLGIEEAEARAATRLIWWIWFGTNIDEVEPTRLRALAQQFDRAIVGADLLGVPSAERLAGDAAHIGYLAALERHLAALDVSRTGLLCDAVLNYRLNETDPFLAGLLGGLDFLGVVSPHPELAAQLGRRFGIATVAAYDVPGENRLARARERSDRGHHFPTIFDRLTTELVVPRRGAVFLVAAGLLGKIYCDRIKTLGGIALDVGAVADAWMGYDTRDGVLAPSLRQTLAAPDEAAASAK